MWALRRASVFKNHGLNFRVSQIFCIKSDIALSSLDKYNSGCVESKEFMLDGLQSFARSYYASSGSKLCLDECTFSSQARTKSGEEEDDALEDGFSELETPSDAVPDDLMSDSDASEKDSSPNDLQFLLEGLATSIDDGKNKKQKCRVVSSMTEAILSVPIASVFRSLDKWVEEGNSVSRKEATLTFLNLRKRKFFGKALKLSEWLELRKHIDFEEGDYASRVDLIAKTHGMDKAEKYINKIPQSFIGELVYRTLLANYVSMANVKKSVEVFSKMKDLKFPLSCFTYNQLLLLYKRTDKKKIAEVLLLMEREDIKLSLFTYQVLVDVKGLSKDISGMEQLVETMKAEGLKPNTKIQTTLARHYATAGKRDKAESVLKEIEAENMEENRRACSILLPIYASLGKVDEVHRLWKACESNPHFQECKAAIIAWGKLGKIEDAEAAFEKMFIHVKKPSSKHFSDLLKVYTDYKMLVKGKELVKRMVESGCNILPSNVDSIIKLHIEGGDMKKAEGILAKAVKQNYGKPMYDSFLCIMNHYANKGDIHNAEKIFLMMRRAGYVSRLQQYQLLVRAYVNAKAPGYGLADRLKADDIFPNKSLAAELTRVDPFRKSEVDVLLDTMT